ncbi:hypothetical protein D9758_008390 [Tetrapyrgos nigripes]|uniref:Glycosyltransferase family 28 N-terminal domain-containing protein n=1 Tax=Tetrapyrgos nigripes TaxID=182062 RepID=A0A8H5GEA4_9AGAR|nr:hypothetical protein D9758_008390 [Tetrapyrgos nigripes]
MTVPGTMSSRNKDEKSELPFYMQQNDDQTPLLPRADLTGTTSGEETATRAHEVRTEERGKSPLKTEDVNAKYVVEMGSVETEPKIGTFYSPLQVFSNLTKSHYFRTDYINFTAIGRGLSSFARVEPDGRINVSLDLKKSLPDLPPDYAKAVEQFGVDTREWQKFPGPMSIVIMIVGSRGDVQPYLASGKRLIQQGHRVRIATHGSFRSFVDEVGGGLEFFDIGGNPQELMSYMVKNPGLIPGITSLTNGDIGRKRKMLAEVSIVFSQSKA